LLLRIGLLLRLLLLPLPLRLPPLLPPSARQIQILLQMTDGEQQDALVKRSEDEREDIFRRYELGMDPSNVVDPWENPTFELYHRTDK